MFLLYLFDFVAIHVIFQYLYLIPRFYSTRVIDDYLDDNEWKFRINLIKKIE